MNTTKRIPNVEEVQHGVTWIGGPTHQLQRQHIPGYQGHVHGLFSQNVHGKNFARVSAQCVNRRNQIGIDIKNDLKYQSTYKDQYEQPNLRKNQFINTAQSVLGKLERVQSQINNGIQTNYSKQPKSIQEVAPIDRIPVIGYMGHRPVFRKPIKQVKQPQVPQKVELQQKKVLEQMMKTGDFDVKKYQQTNKNVPVVGYCGFLKGIKAENQYAQSFEQLAKNSIRQ